MNTQGARGWGPARLPSPPIPVVPECPREHLLDPVSLRAPSCLGPSCRSFSRVCPQGRREAARQGLEESLAPPTRNFRPGKGSGRKQPVGRPC